MKNTGSQTRFPRTSRNHIQVPNGGIWEVPKVGDVQDPHTAPTPSLMPTRREEKDGAGCPIHRQLAGSPFDTPSCRGGVLDPPPLPDAHTKSISRDWGARPIDVSWLPTPVPGGGPSWPSTSIYSVLHRDVIEVQEGHALPSNPPFGPLMPTPKVVVGSGVHCRSLHISCPAPRPRWGPSWPSTSCGSGISSSASSGSGPRISPAQYFRVAIQGAIPQIPRSTITAFGLFLVAFFSACSPHSLFHSCGFVSPSNSPPCLSRLY